MRMTSNFDVSRSDPSRFNVSSAKVTAFLV
jgi:hypothetical protein